MKNIILTLTTIFLLLPFVTGAQTLTIEQAEYAFTLGKNQLIDSLKAEGFKNLTAKEIEDEIFKSSINEGMSINPKKLIYTKNGLRIQYELRKIFYGGMCKVSIVMKEPTCKTVNIVYWNANLTYDTGSYVRKLNALGYKQVFDNNLEKFVNKDRGLVVTVLIFKRTNEIKFMMARII